MSWTEHPPKGYIQTKLEQLKKGEMTKFPYTTSKAGIVRSSKIIGITVRVREVGNSWVVLRIK